MKHNSIYLEHLLRNIYQQQCRDLIQRGKSNIEPMNFEKQIGNWYAELIDMVRSQEPEYYVKGMSICEDQGNRIIKVCYDYCSPSEWVDCITVGIYWE